MSPKIQAPRETIIDIPEIQQGRLNLCLLGSRPLICNRMSEKAWRELLLPYGRKNAAERQSTLKHNPYAEYRASPYKISDPESPALLAVMSSAFKGAMGTAALDMAGVKKAQIERLTDVEGDYTLVYGAPKLYMAVVRNSDINHTPDIRTRAILPRWAARVEISFIEPMLNAQKVANLLTGAGVMAGLGDWRPEKGGNFGKFRIVRPEDPEFQLVLRDGREVQQRLLKDPEPYDDESASMLDWFAKDVRRRGFDPSTLIEEEFTEEEVEEAVEAAGEAVPVG